MTTTRTRTALVTGASRGLGLALTTALLDDGWHVVVDGRDVERLAAAATSWPADRVSVVAGDVSDVAHRRRLVDAVTALGHLDLLVNNASILGPSPQPALSAYPMDVLEQVYRVNTFAPLALIQALNPMLHHGCVINVSSDAAVEAYAGWGGYGSAKAALDQLTAVLAVELPHLRVYAFDPGDMATDLQQQAFPGEDVSDRADPRTVVPALLRLVSGGLPSGRFKAADLQGVSA